MASSLEIGDRFDLARALSGAARADRVRRGGGPALGPLRAAAPGPGRTAPPAGAPPARQRASSSTSERWRWPATPRPPATRRWCCAWPRRRPAPDCRWRRAPCTSSPTPRPSCGNPGHGRRWTSCCRCWAPGAPLVDVVESLDRTGLWGRLFPEWGAVRDLPPARPRARLDRRPAPGRGLRAFAARLTTRVARPDLLLVGSLLHDIGKGRGGDHSVVGESVAQQVGRRLGFAEPDVALLGAMVAPPPAAAAHRDAPRPRRPGDDHARRRHPRRHRRGPQGRGRPGLLLDLLEALAEADSLATGPGVWSPWKQSLLGRTGSRAAGPHWPGSGSAASPPNPSPPDVVAAVAAGGRLQVRFSGRNPATVLVVRRRPPGRALGRGGGARPALAGGARGRAGDRPRTARARRAGRSRCCGSRCRRASAASPTRPCCGRSWAVCSTARSPSARRWPARSATTPRCCRRARSPPRPGCCGSTTR